MNCPHNECRIRQTCTQPSACVDPARRTVSLARHVINEHAHAVTQEIAEQLATAVINGAHERDALRSTLTTLTAERDALRLERDAAKAEAKITRRAATTSEEGARAWSDAVASWRHVAGENAKSIDRLTVERDAARKEAKRLGGKISDDDEAHREVMLSAFALSVRSDGSIPTLTAGRIPGDPIPLSLDEYEAANLQWGLRVLRQLGLDTGDWLGQILRRIDGDYGQPNMDEAFTDVTIARLLEPRENNK